MSKHVPADALRYGTRDEMLALAHKRIADRPDRYVNHIYGEKELGGTSVLLCVGRAVRETRLPHVRGEAFPAFTTTALGAVPAVMAVGALLGASYTPSSGSGFRRWLTTTATSNSSLSGTS